MKIIKDIQTIKPFILANNLTHIFDSSMINQLQIHYFEANEMIIEEKTKVSNLYLVIDGEANVTPSSATGKIGFLEFILPMDIIGDMEYFTDSLYLHSVVAHTDCTYLAIPITLISTKLTTNGVFYHFVCRNMASKMKRTSMRYSNLLLYPLKNRLAKMLLEFSLSNQTRQLSMSTDQLAELFSVTARHIRRVLSELEKAAIISRSRDTISILNQEMLEELTNETN